MGILNKRDSLAIMQQTQENLDASQKNNELLTNALNQLLSLNKEQQENPMDDQDKLKAAYALNLCTVSVSQIIDYNDVNFLEHEYEAILNNLNLEEMPKDDALLHILKQLLDVITYFRIQEDEKKLLEKEYQQKMKNAIWSAVPHIGLIPSGGNPVTMAVSLASQVGIGYMNYRKEKAKIGLEQERKEWELQRSAMEQFNGLRRELFDTAWRLAEKYKFPDEYRLTERQITQFNRILLDTDDLRRYERLKYIEDKFVAYPPFWYYLGNAANAVCQNSDAYGEEICAEYKDLAKEAFNKFLNSTKRNLLREDQLEASCALELFDLLEDSEVNRKRELLETAKKASGNAFDVLELCAMSFWKMGETEKAAELFRVLVNEEYNTLVNAQLLSTIYVSQAVLEMLPESRKMYQTLQVRVGAENLFPMPPDNSTGILLDDVFIDTQKDILRDQYVAALTDFIKKYNSEYEAICDTEGDISKDILNLLEAMCDAVRKIAPDHVFTHPLQSKVLEQRKELQTMLTCSKSGGQRKPIVTFQVITSDAFKQLAKYIGKRIDDMDTMYLISEAEMDLDQFCIENNLRRIKPVRGNNALSINTTNPIAQALLDEKFQYQQYLSGKAEECVNTVTSIVGSKPILSSNKKGNVFFYIRGDHHFDTYLKKNEKALLKCYTSLTPIIAIINDRSLWDQDLILATGSITLFEKKKSKGNLMYTEAANNYSHNGLQFGRHCFSNAAVNMEVLREITDQLSSIQANNQSTTNESIQELILSVKTAILQTPSEYKAEKSAQKDVIDSLIQYGYNTSSMQKISDYSILKEIELLKSNDRLVRIRGQVIKGKPLKYSYCKLDGQDGLYKIISVGTTGNNTGCKEGHITAFALERIW